MYQNKSRKRWKIGDVHISYCNYNELCWLMRVDGFKVLRFFFLLFFADFINYLLNFSKLNNAR
jgi:hypothetical protein